MSPEIVLEFLHIIMGVQLFYVGYRTFKDQTLNHRLGTSAFWTLLGVLFTFGTYIPNWINGALICVIAVLTLFKQVELGQVRVNKEADLEERADRIGNKIFIPVILLAIVSISVAFILPDYGKVAIGFGAVISTLAIFWITKATPQDFLEENNRMIQQMSTTSILPQLLAALGAIFTAAGVGELIADLIGGVMPEGNALIGVIAYVMGMVIFTAVMGNAFAAFTVITAGIGVPFVFMQGGDPVIAGALAMTAGYCGTLLTPMAGNFNALPVALLQMKNDYGVIKEQAPVALAMTLVHIVLMYVLAF